MRKLFTLLSFALVACSMLAFTSCSKDDEPRTNKFTVDGVDYELTSATLQNYGNHGDSFQGYNTDLAFYGDGVEIYFWACSTIGTALDKRTYKFSQDVPYAIGTFTPNSDWGNEGNGGKGPNFTKGSFKVIAVSGDQYEIEFSCEDEDGRKVTGYYKGTVTFVDQRLS